MATPYAKQLQHNKMVAEYEQMADDAEDAISDRDTIKRLRDELATARHGADYWAGIAATRTVELETANGELEESRCEASDLAGQVRDLHDALTEANQDNELLRGALDEMRTAARMFALGA